MKSNGENINDQRKEELLRLFNEKAPIARTFGMKLSFTEDGRAVIDLPYNPNLNHALGAIHGGIYATVLDNAGWFTAAVLHELSRWLATSELTIHFLEPAQGVAIRGIGKIIRHGKRQDVVEMFLYDETGHLIAHAVGTFVVVQNASLNNRREVSQ